MKKLLLFIFLSLYFDAAHASFVPFVEFIEGDYYQKLALIDDFVKKDKYLSLFPNLAKDNILRSLKGIAKDSFQDVLEHEAAIYSEIIKRHCLTYPTDLALADARAKKSLDYFNEIYRKKFMTNKL